MGFFLEEQAECWAVPWENSATGGLRAEVPQALLGAVEPLTPCCPPPCLWWADSHPATAPLMEKTKKIS